jgi:hypothetical protein
LDTIQIIRQTIWLINTIIETEKISQRAGTSSATESGFIKNLINYLISSHNDRKKICDTNLQILDYDRSLSIYE